MNIFEIRDILQAHKEHFRVLPTLSQNDLLGIIQEIDAEIAAQKEEPKPVKKESPAKSFTTGRVAKKKAKKKVNNNA